MSLEICPDADQDDATNEAQESTGMLGAITGQTPWWIVSILMHALIITLAALLSIVIELPVEAVPMQSVTIIGPPMALTVDPRDPAKPDDPLKPIEKPSNGKDKDGINLLVDPDFLTRAVEGPEFRTKTSEPYDELGALGDPRAQLLYGGHTGELGGGGTNGPELSELNIGVGGPGSLGSGDGYGGGKGPGNGTGDGRGTASWGFPKRGSPIDMIGKYNPGNPNRVKVIPQATDLGLEWLAYHQETDGHWDAKKYEAVVKTDTAVTGMALLAFLGAGHTERVGKFKGNVAKAVAWLKTNQSADGCIWDTSDDGAGHRRVGYPHAIATLAMVEAAAMGRISETKAAAQKAVDYCTEVHQSGEGYDKGGWRYGPKSEGDLSVSGWYIMALKSAKVAGLKVPTASFDGAIKFLDSVEVKEDASVPYAASHYKYMATNEHGHTAHRLSAIGTLARQFLGWKKEDLQSTVDAFVAKGGVPSYGANGESVDLYYWYYGSLCVFQQQGETWTRWNNAMLKALIENQCKQGDAKGSWNPAGEFSSEWGRVGQTALSAMCLEVYYRYELVKAK